MGCRVLEGVRNDGGGVDIVVDTVGQPALAQAAIGKLAKGGRLAFIAVPRGGGTGLEMDMLSFYRREKSLIGCNSLSYRVEEMAREIGKLTEKFEKGMLKGVDEGAWTEIKLKHGFEAYKKAAEKKGIKIVIVMD